MRKQKSYCVYILSNQRITVLYTGVSGNLFKRDWQHQNKTMNGFTKKYNVDKLIYYECFDNPSDAICREKQLKGWSKIKKINLIKTINPELKDLSEKWLFSDYLVE